MAYLLIFESFIIPRVVHKDWLSDLKGNVRMSECLAAEFEKSSTIQW